MNPQHLLCAQLCAASYDAADPRFVTVEELRFGVIHVGDTAYLVFRGTDNLQGWLDDFEVIPGETINGYTAHKGFIRAAEKLHDAVSERLTVTGRVVITGHSLGGALALLFAEDFRNDPVVTFGCPRVYSRLNESYPVMEHARYANRGDPIADIPDEILWRHLCEAIALGEEAFPERKNHDINLYISRLSQG